MATRLFPARIPASLKRLHPWEGIAASRTGRMTADPLFFVIVHQLIAADHSAKLCPIVMGYLRDETDQESYDTVRSPFWEGQSLYEGTEFMQQTHIQIAVRSKSAVKGWFRVLDSEGWPIQIQQADEEVEANLTAFPIVTAGLDGEL